MNSTPAPTTSNAPHPAPALGTTAAVPAPATAAPAPAVGQRRARLALGLLVSAQFVVMLDTSIVNVALPSMQSDLRLDSASLSWIVNAYVLTFGGLLLTCGRIADLLGRRRMFTAGAVVFTLGTLLAASAGSEWTLIAGRVIQGAGAAALSPAAMALLLVNFPGAQRARAMSLWGAASAVGGATGVAVGGLLAGTFGWPAVFLVTVPATIAAAALAGRVLEDSARGARRGIDVAGAVFLTSAVVSFVHGSLRLAAHDWTDAAVFGLAVPVLAVLVFNRTERRAVDPLVPLEVFRAGELPSSVALALFGGAVRASTFVLVALYLQQALTMSPQHGGLAMVPTSLTGLCISLTVLPRSLRALGPRWSIVVGLGVLATGHLWLGYAPAGAGYAFGVLPGLVLVATGVALSFTPTTMVVAATMPGSHAGLASGLASSATQVGAALGTATLLTVAGTAGFSVAFTVAALASMLTASLGWTHARRPHSAAAARR